MPRQLYLGLALLMVSLMIFIALTPPLSADPAYGLLRSFSPEPSNGMPTRGLAYDLEIDEDGIYIVGFESSPNGDGKGAIITQSTFLIILEPDHSPRCSIVFGFPSDPLFSVSSGISVEVNQTHVFVAGIYFTNRLGNIVVFVSAFSKSSCIMTGIYRLYVTDYEEISAITFITGEGVDLAVDETGIYLLVGYFLVEGRGFHVLKLDNSLQPVAEDFYYIGDPRRDFGLSIALGDESVYVAGLTEFDVRDFIRLEGSGIFLLELDKNNLAVKNATLLSPIDGYFAGLEVVVDEDNNIYVARTYQKYMAIDQIGVTKFDRRMNELWTQVYLLWYPYWSTSPPYHVPVEFAYGVTAAVSSAYLFIGGFTTTNYLGEKNEAYSGLLLAVNREDGEGLFAYRIQPQEGPSGYVVVMGVDAFRDCAYLAGYSNNYRLEYVFLNNFNFTFPALARNAGAIRTGDKHEMREDRPVIESWVPIFDTDTGAELYGFYGVFCARGMVASTTTISTSTVTSTDLVRRTTTSTVRVFTTTTRYETETVYSTGTLYQTQVVYSTRFTTREEVVHSTVFSTVYRTFGRPGTETVTYTAVEPRTFFRNTTTTVYHNTTSYVVTTAAVDWLGLPLWVYTPFLFMPIPLAAVLLRGRRHVVVINKSSTPPTWRPGNPPIVDDAYMMPSVLNIRRKTVVEFVNKDEDSHIIVSYEGPAEHLFRSDEINPGKKWKHKFTEPGIYYIKSLSKQYIGGVIRVGR